MTLDALLDLYLDGLDADERLSVKTRFDYRKNADAYVRPLLGDRPVRDITPETVLEWQRHLAKGGGVKTGRALSPNTIRLARAPLAGAFKLAVSTGLLAVNQWRRRRDLPASGPCPATGARRRPGRSSASWRPTAPTRSGRSC